MQLVVAIYGYNMIHYLQRILAVVLCVGFLVITVVSVARGYQGAFGSNPCRHLLGRQRRWVGDLRGILPVVPHRLVAVRLGLLALPAGPGGGQPGRRPVDGRRGLRLAVVARHRRSHPGRFGGHRGEPIEALQRLTGPFAIPALLTVLLSSFSQNFLNVYGGAISIQTLRIPVSRRTAVIFICVIAFLISLWADENFESKFKRSCSWARTSSPPSVPVLLLDYVLNRRRERIRQYYKHHPDPGMGFRRLARRCARVRPAVLAAVLLHGPGLRRASPSGATSPTSSDSPSPQWPSWPRTGFRRCGIRWTPVFPDEVHHVPPPTSLDSRAAVECISQGGREASRLRDDTRQPGFGVRTGRRREPIPSAGRCGVSAIVARIYPKNSAVTRAWNTSDMLSRNAIRELRGH